MFVLGEAWKGKGLLKKLKKGRRSPEGRAHIQGQLGSPQPMQLGMAQDSMCLAPAAIQYHHSLKGRAFPDNFCALSKEKRYSFCC